MGKSSKKNEGKTAEEIAVIKEPASIPIEFSWRNGHQYSSEKFRLTTARLIERGLTVYDSVNKERSAAKFLEWKTEFRKHCKLIKKDDFFPAKVITCIVDGAIDIHWNGKLPVRKKDERIPVQIAAMRGESMIEYRSSVAQ